MREVEYEIVRDLSFAEPFTSASVTRRRFLQAIAMGTAVSALPGWMQEAAAAPLGVNEGMLVLLQLSGGNDGLDTVIPYDNSTYQSIRGSLSWDGNETLPLSPGIGLHPGLTNLKSRWDAGNVAIIRGVGYPNPDLSHFSSMAYWMSGEFSNTLTPTGWIGRYLDEMGSNPLQGVNVGYGVPLIYAGQNVNACALPETRDGLFGADASDEVEQRFFDTLTAFGTTSRGSGTLLDKYAQCESSSMTTANELFNSYPAPVDEESVLRQMTVCARLINANIGIRVLSVDIGGFDNHAEQRADHDYLMTLVDTAIERFFATLEPAYASRVTLMTFSEFGRRPEENGSGGTDHGTASCLFVVGRNVRGGIYGDQPSLTDLDNDGNLKASVDFRAVYATVLDRWLAADSSEILGGSFTEFDLFTSGPSASPNPLPGTPGLGSPPATPATALRSYRIVDASGAVASFGLAPDLGSASSGGNRVAGMATCLQHTGYWLVRANGEVHAFGDAQHRGSMAGQRLNAPMVAIASTPSGNGYWLLGSDGGVFSFGDAAFYGSTGSLKLNKPVVAMAAVPTGAGYWFCASDGGIFAYGPDARFFGSMGGKSLNMPVVGMAATPTGKGYWLVASDGGVFSFGDAAFYGSTGSLKLNKPIVAMAATPTGKGYRFVASDGGVFCFGDATFEGSLGDRPSAAGVVGIA